MTGPRRRGPVIQRDSVFKSPELGKSGQRQDNYGDDRDLQDGNPSNLRARALD